METQKYQGFTNYETWAVFTWLSNEESSYTYWTDAAADNMRRAHMFPHNVFTVSEDARYGLADMLKDEFTESAPNLGGTLWADLLNAALSEVDWADVADTLLSDREGYEHA